LLVGAREAYDGHESWIYGVQGYAEGSCSVIYLEAWYFAALSLTSVGYGDVLLTPLERTVNSFFLLLAQLFTAKVCADLTWLTTTCNHWEAQHQAWRAQAWVALQHMQVPRVLAERVLAFQSYRAKVHREDLTQPAFKGLSANLMRELRLCAYRKLVLQAPFLRGQPKDVIAFIVGSLDDCVYLPADIIVRSGDRGRELFFMRRGEAAVFVGPDPPCVGRSKAVAAYNAGDYFGELGMLTGHPRAAWIMAKTYCVCSIFAYSAVEALGMQYPGAFTTLVQAMVKQYQLKSSLSWEQVSARFGERYGFESVEEAFAWFCQHGDGPDEDELGAKAFDDCLRRVKVPALDRKILWAEMDADNSGTVTLDEFGDKVIVDPGRWPARSPIKKLSGSSCCPNPKDTPMGSRMPTWRQPTLGTFNQGLGLACLGVPGKDRETLELLQEVRKELAESREMSRQLVAEVSILRSAREAERDGAAAPKVQPMESSECMELTSADDATSESQSLPDGPSLAT